MQSSQIAMTLGLFFALQTLLAQERVIEPGEHATYAWVMPKTEYGQPDLQGEWWFGSRTPLERPTALGDKRVYSRQEASKLEARMGDRNKALAAPLDPMRGAPERGAVIRQEADDNFLSHYQEPLMVPVFGEYRTSIISSPADGRIPHTPGFQDFYAQRKRNGLTPTDGPEGQPLSGRCLGFGSALPSLTPIMMNPNMQIVQTEDYVLIMTEMSHDARIVRLGKDHSTNGFATWMGESVGYWDEDTLVVHTKGFRPEQSAMRGFKISGEFEVVERYTRTGEDLIHFAFEVIDPYALTQPVSGERMLTKNSKSDRIYEFACHEGNYSLPNILRGARQQERDAVDR